MNPRDALALTVERRAELRRAAGGRASSRAADSRGGAVTRLVPGRMRQRAGMWLVEAGLHLMTRADQSGSARLSSTPAR